MKGKVFNQTLYGLKNNSKVKIKFNLDEKKVTEIQGSDCSMENAEIAESLMFSFPTFIKIDGIPFYPTKYEIISSGDVYYSSSKVSLHCTTS